MVQNARSHSVPGVFRLFSIVGFQHFHGCILRTLDMKRRHALSAFGGKLVDTLQQLINFGQAFMQALWAREGSRAQEVDAGALAGPHAP